MEITYKKNNNTELFANFKDPMLLNMDECQNYVPIYNNFFMLNDKNYNSINLNNKFMLTSITKKITENVFEGAICGDDDKVVSKQIFFKLCYLLDPFKYLAGKYDIEDTNLFNLPKLNDENCHYKVHDINNSSYVDSFFTYLTGELKNKHNFIHGIDFYGSYLGIKNNYNIDIGDDIDMLSSNDFFHEHTNHLFKFVNIEHEDIFNEDSRKNKKKLDLVESNDCDIDLDLDIINIENNKNENNENENNENKNENKNENNENENNENENNDNELILDLSSMVISENNIDSNNIDSNNKSKHTKNTNSSCSECSSRSSNTQNSKAEDSDESDESDESDGSDGSDVENIMVSINKFPIQIVAMENCTNTLDSLFVENKLKQEELGCIVTQILMMLITYQKLFKLTHNDLHTNNIMYVETDRHFLYYKVNNKHYKVRTYGKLFKIIDFGRSIYEYKNKVICSDSFHKDGDATSQYNCEPYFNKDKPRLEPNFSFDLCRLGCAIYDFITEKYETLEDIHWPIHKIIMKWCIDDDKRDILYKNNGEERYPDFKLYKMIARKVHNHIPINELKNKFFDKFVVPRREIKKGSPIWNIDTLVADNIVDSLNSEIVLDACD